MLLWTVLDFGMTTSLIIVCINWLAERAILSAKNKDVCQLKADTLSDVPGQIITYLSIDTAMNQDDAINYPTEFLNSMDLPGLPPHRLQIKVCAPIILLRNLIQPLLCNGTRLVVKKAMNNIIESTILNGKFMGEDVLIPRIPLIPPDLPFKFKRLQFPIRLAFAITINKAQGQSLKLCGINLENPCFSRVGKPSALFIYTQLQINKKNLRLRDSSDGSSYFTPVIHDVAAQ